MLDDFPPFSPASADDLAPPQNLRSDRERALWCLEHFRRFVFPAALRRLGRWKGLDPRYAGDLIEDLIQDVALDAVENAEEVCALDRRGRHRRWLRLVHLGHYRLQERNVRRRVILPEERLDRAGERGADAVASDEDELAHQLARLPPNDRAVVDALLGGAGRTHASGRLNKRVTAPIVGLSSRALAASLRRCAVQFAPGDGEYVSFWRRRTGEALLDLAADRLRLASDVDCLADSVPDPGAAVRTEVP